MAQTHITACMTMHACSHRARRLDHAIGGALGAWFGCGRSCGSKSTALFSDMAACHAGGDARIKVVGVGGGGGNAVNRMISSGLQVRLPAGLTMPQLCRCHAIQQSACPTCPTHLEPP